MSTKTRKHIETEKNFNEEAVIKRLGELRKRELEDTKIAKDTRLRHLKAKVKQANRARTPHAIRRKGLKENVPV